MTVEQPIHAVDAYLRRLAPNNRAQRALRARVAEQQPATRAEALDCLHRELARLTGAEGNHRQRNIVGRLALAYPGLWARPEVQSRPNALRTASMPRFNRWPMRPADIDWRFRRFLPFDRLRRRERRPPAVASRLKRVVRWRQNLLAVLIALPALAAASYMLTVLPRHGHGALEIVILAMAFLLFAWILVGFWTALAGFFVLWRGERHLISAAPRVSGSETVPASDETPVRTAVVMPIFEEDVARTFAGIQAIYESLEATQRLDEFDFFMLSDSSDPDTIVAEQQAWVETCRALDAFGRLFYRRRRASIKRKSGNIADFCRRWGGHYRYMVVLDADSIMLGDTIAALVDRMQAHPEAGLIQTPPAAVNSQTVLARVEQFATRVYGRMFAAGLHYWHLDNAHYWGHNAIIRIAPFMAHCALPRLPGRGALSGEIMSHDFVEAALMRRAGWGVYIAYDLAGSYEQAPPDLLEDLRRDRRWCQGNIQHMRLLFSDNLAPAHRALFANGVMAYTSAAIWFVFLLLSSTEAVLQSLRTPDYFPVAGALFPDWPVWQPIWAISLFVVTMIVLFVPKILGVILIAAEGRQHEYGGIARLIGSSVTEIALTSLLAPIRMLAHTRFVCVTLLGRQVKWVSTQRDETGVAWRRALRYHLPGMLIAAVWAGVLYWYTPGFAPWLAPILIPLLMAPAITVITARRDLGGWLRARGWQLTPEEKRPLAILCRIHELTHGQYDDTGFAAVVADPAVNALHIALNARPRDAIDERRREQADAALRAGPDAVDTSARGQLLADTRRLHWLHDTVWARQPEGWRHWVPTADDAAARHHSPAFFTGRVTQPPGGAV